MVQNVRMNPYFDISSKTKICQKCHLRPYCIQPSIWLPYLVKRTTDTYDTDDLYRCQRTNQINVVNNVLCVLNFVRRNCSGKLRMMMISIEVKSQQRTML